MEPTERPHVEIFHMQDQFPALWTRNKIAATDRSWWFYDVRHASQWFTAFCIGLLEPGQSEGFHSHHPDTEGPYECWYVVLDGLGEVRTEFGDHRLGKFDAAFMPPASSHQMRNPGTERLWYGSISSRGNAPLVVDTYGIQCSEERPGYMEEYERIMAARRSRGLSVP
jgi:mannose-6-phosphate isomerase-like protein (cupin superfamily)